MTDADRHPPLHLVTGASRGIGEAVADALATQGAEVIAVARSMSEGRSGTVMGVAADVTRTADVDRIVDIVGGRPLASVLHAAGSQVELRPWTELGDGDVLAADLASHLLAPIALTRALLDRGTVARMAIVDSYASTTPRVGWGAYAITKAACQMSARVAALELPDTRVMRIFPGAVDTPLLRQVLGGPEDVPAVHFYRAYVAEHGVSDPEDVGREIADLLVTDAADLGDAEAFAVGKATLT